MIDMVKIRVLAELSTQEIKLYLKGCEWQQQAQHQDMVRKLLSPIYSQSLDLESGKVP